jgi:hypothetical protein
MILPVNQIRKVAGDATHFTSDTYDGNVEGSIFTSLPPRLLLVSVPSYLTYRRVWITVHSSGTLGSIGANLIFRSAGETVLNLPYTQRNVGGATRPTFAFALGQGIPSGPFLDNNLWVAGPAVGDIASPSFDLPVCADEIEFNIANASLPSSFWQAILAVESMSDYGCRY